ncbi:MAG: hypothetical protein EHM24_20110, partial [Acidobacteria bacterium]
MPFVLLLLALIAQSATPPLPTFNAAAAAVSAPATLAQFDGGKLKGEPAGLAWSADGAQFYLRTAEYDRWRNERAHHYVVAATGGVPTPILEAPAWALAYWAWKSGFVAPGSPDLRLETDVQQRIATAVGSVSDGGLSQSRADPNRSQVESDMASAQKVNTITVTFKGQLLMKLENEALLPGVRYGWAPAGVSALAYSDGKRRLVLVDRAGRTLEVPGATDVLLPAWSPDG